MTTFNKMKYLFISLLGIIIVIFFLVYLGLMVDIKYLIDDPVNKCNVNTSFLYNKLSFILFLFLSSSALATFFLLKRKK